MSIQQPRPSDQQLRETLLAVRAKLKIALHLAQDRAQSRGCRWSGKR